MAENERLVEVKLMGQEFSFYTASSAEEMDSILALVQNLIEVDPRQKTGTLPMGKIAILACLNIASQHVKLQNEFEAYRRDSEERLRELSDEIRALIKE